MHVQIDASEHIAMILLQIAIALCKPTMWRQVGLSGDVSQESDSASFLCPSQLLACIRARIFLFNQGRRSLSLSAAAEPSHISNIDCKRERGAGANLQTSLLLKHSRATSVTSDKDQRGVSTSGSG